MSTEAKDLAAAYFEAWTAKDFDRMRTLLADDVTFRGPLGQADGVEECLAGLEGMSRMMTGVDVHARLSEGDDVMTWFELQTAEAPPLPTVNWSRVADGRISRIRVAFDPRPLFAEDE